MKLGLITFEDPDHAYMQYVHLGQPCTEGGTAIFECRRTKSRESWGVIPLIEDDKWYLARTKGNHRQYRHPVVKGSVTISRSWLMMLHRGTSNSILKQVGLKEVEEILKYTTVIGKADGNYSSCCPDLPGSISTGASV